MNYTGRARRMWRTQSAVRQIRRRSGWIAPACLGLAWIGFTSAPPAAAQVTLYTTVDMALRNSPGVRLATADLQKAAAALSESKDVYLPSITFGSSLGYAYGFPTGLPSIYNLGGQSLVFSFSQPDYIRAARAGLRASELALKDARQQVILDTALGYIQLDKITRELKTADEEASYIDRLLSIEQERVQAGLDSRTESLKAQLAAAQLHLKRIHLENQATGLRQQLAHLTGLPQSGFIVCADCIPAPPELKTDSNSLHGGIVSNAGVQAAYENAKSRQFIDFGDKRQILRPQFAFAAQYNRYASFNNYADYYRRFQHNSFGIGVQIVVPLFDQSRRAKERASAADAIHATAQADQVRDQSEEQLTRLQSALLELNAQQEVANLQQQLAQGQLEVIRIQLESSSSSSTGVPLTPKDEQLAHIQERQRFADLLDVKLELMRAQLGLLRLTGGLEDWVKQAPQH